MKKARLSSIIFAILLLAFAAWRFIPLDGHAADSSPVKELSVIEGHPKPPRIPSGLASPPNIAPTASISPRPDDTVRHAAMLLDDSDGMSDVRAALLRETRDARWADAAEASLRSSFSKMPGLGKDGRMLDIRCGSATCEVLGELAPGKQGAGAQKEMQAIDFVQAMDDRGYRMSNMGFAPSDVTGRDIFLAYYKRGPAR
jgi:hypothetical protein